MHANFLKLELETLSDELTVETTSSNFRLEIYLFCYVKKQFCKDIRAAKFLIAYFRVKSRHVMPLIYSPEDREYFQVKLLAFIWILIQVA